jgi:hypothetical protein
MKAARFPGGPLHAGFAPFAGRDSVATRGNGESAALDRLEADDATFEKILEEARLAAARTVEDARAEAAAEAAAARAALEVEVAAIREEAARDVAALDAESEGRAEAAAAAVRDAAANRLEAAVSLVVRTVAGEAP